MKSVLLAGAFAGSLSIAASACGPWLPSLLLVDHKQQALHAPVTTFREELSRLPALPKLPPGLRGHAIDEDEYQRMRAGELQINKGEEQDVLDALAYHRVALERRDVIAGAYWRVRHAMQEIRNPELVRREVNIDGADILQSIPLPDDLPAELADYLRGAIAFHCGQIAEARACWEKLLARPAAERRFRSTWAAYMLGRMAGWEAEDNAAKCAEAKRWLQRVRTLAQEGCEDRLNLVGMSYYWEAMLAENNEKAAPLFCLAFAAGCPWAVEALRGIGEEILNSEDYPARVRAARVPLLRQLVTASAVTDFSPGRYEWENFDENGGMKGMLHEWLDTIEAAHVKVAEDADRLAWAAYDAGDFAGAARWVKKARGDAPLAQWIRGKLALRAGHNADATQRFQAALRCYPRQPPGIYPEFRWWEGGGVVDGQAMQAQQLEADLGLTEMARGHYPQALDAFLRSSYWLDAAYVAEQVMTTDELLVFYRRHPELQAKPKQHEKKGDEEDASPVAQLRTDAASGFRYLLARRLARDGRLLEARSFMPEPLRGDFEEYRAKYRLGHDRHESTEERASALWEAARIHRYLGMELFGAETAPDWSFFDGQYELDDIGAIRAGLRKPQWHDDNDKKTTWLPRVRHEETARNLRLRPTPNTRFHYRYIAAELAWEAAKLKPPGDETARMLCIAGRWLKDMDPQAADRFYQELVGKCAQTDLGRDGERRRWFPSAKDEPFVNPLTKQP